MRVLFVPHTSSPTLLHTDHLYAWANNFFLSWLKARPELVLYWVVPKKAPELQKQAFVKFQPFMDQIRFIEAKCDQVQVVEQNTIPDSVTRKFHCVKGSYMFDCLFSEKPGTIVDFMSGMWMWPVMRDYKTIVGGFQYMMDNARRDNNLLETEYAQILGSMACDYLQFCSPANAQDCRGKWAEKLAKYLSGTLAFKALSIPHGYKSFVNIDALNELYAGRDAALASSSDVFQIHYAFGMNSVQFNFTKLVTTLIQYRKMEPALRFLVTTPSNGGMVLQKLADLDFTRVYKACTRERFHQMALRSHAFIYYYDQAGSNSGSFWELAMLGVLPLVKRGGLPYPWHTEWPDYPFQFSGTTDLIALMKWVRSRPNDPKIVDAVKRNRELIMKAAASECSNEVRWQFIENDQKKKLHAKGAINFPLSSFIDDMPKEILLSQASEIIRLKSDTKKAIGKKSIGVPMMSLFTRDLLRTAMMQKGYVDVGGLDDPKMVRRDT